jgi:hypothetical protein
VAISAKNFTLVNFRQQFVQRYFRVLANTKQFVAFYMVEIKRSRMCVKPAHRATIFSLNFVNQIAPCLLKRLCHQLFSWRVISAFRRAEFLPRSVRGKTCSASWACTLHDFQTKSPVLHSHREVLADPQGAGRMQNRAYLDTPPSVKELYHKKVGPTRCVCRWHGVRTLQYTTLTASAFGPDFT